MKQCKIDRISIDNQGDSLNRESLDSNTQILHPGVIVNGQHIKPGTTNEISHRLFWEEVSLGTHPRPAGKGGFAWLGTSAVVRAYIQRSFSHPLDMATFIAKDVVGKRAFMRKQLKGWRRSLYYFPPGLHSHIYSQQRPFLAKLRNALKAAGEWHDVVDASLPTEVRAPPQFSTLPQRPLTHQRPPSMLLLSLLRTCRRAGMRRTMGCTTCGMKRC